MRRPTGKQARVPFIPSVWEFYDLGRDSLKALGDERPLNGTIPEEAASRNIHPEYIRKARQFARTYTHRDVQRLESLCRRHAFPIGISYIIRLITVDPAKREELQATAIAEHWGLRMLEMRIAWEHGRRKKGGRKRLRLEDDTVVYCELDQACETWKRLVAGLREETEGMAAPLDRVDGTVRQHILAAERCLHKLHEVVEDIRQGGLQKGKKQSGCSANTFRAR